jgi:hypothetical protein
MPPTACAAKWTTCSSPACRWARCCAQARRRSPGQVDGLGLYGTSFVYDGWTIPWIGRLSFLLPLVCGLGFGWKQRFHECFPYGIKDERIRQRIASSMLNGDSAAAGLPGNPWPFAGRVLPAVVPRAPPTARIHTPCLVVHAVDDDVASLKNVRMIVRGVRGPVETVLLENSYHMITSIRNATP